MSDELKFPDASERADRDSLSEPLTSLIREAYSPPVSAAESDAYWAGLEQRIMTRVRSVDAGDGRWWTVLAPWARSGLVAAAAIFALAGIVNEQLVETDSQVAYESVVQSSSAETNGAADELVSVQDGSTDSDAAALRYFLSN